MAECSKTARQAYQRTLEYAKEIERILQQLNTNLSTTNSQLLSNKDAARFQFARVLKDLVSEVKHLSKESIEDLVSSLDIKRKLRFAIANQKPVSTITILILQVISQNRLVVDRQIRICFSTTNKTSLCQY